MGYSLEHLMDMYYLILTNTQRSTVYKADAGTFAPKYLLDEQGKRDCYLMFYLYETVVIDNLWKKMTHMLADPFKIKVLRDRRKERKLIQKLACSSIKDI